jgi:precorrin-6B methylase 2
MIMKQLLKLVRKLLRPFGPVLLFMLDSAAYFCLALNRFVGWTYLRLWPILGIHWYDHTFDYLLMPLSNRAAERGILANRYIEPGDVVLDVACGDGSVSGNFCSRQASHVDAFDLDEKAINHANRKYAKPNIAFFVADASRINFPLEKYDVVTCFALIEHLTPEEAGRLLQKLGTYMKSDGVLIGSTLFDVFGANKKVHLNRFYSVQELEAFVASHFEEVILWSSPSPNRVDFYFECRRPRIQAPSQFVNHCAEVISS